MPLHVNSWPASPKELGIGRLADLLPEAEMAFIQEGEGLIGFGQSLILRATGPNRIQDLNRQWQEAVSTAEVLDHVDLAGSGLTAFGTIAFADDSEATSVLVIPNKIIGCVNNKYFITTITNEDFTLVEPREPSDNKLEFKPGQISPEQFQENVAKALKLIDDGEISKIVLARDLVAEAKGFNTATALQNLTVAFPTCYTYLVDGMFGSSPELLVGVKNKKVTARVLAGTAGRGTDVEVDKAIGEALAHSNKNLNEHKYAIDSLVLAMQEHCTEIATTNLPFSLELPNLWHLASDVTAKLNENKSTLQLLKALHPSAAVAGTPKEKAIQLIKEIEGVDRGRYAGPVGWISSNGDGLWAIALRGAQFDGESLRAFAGCGIVKESDPASELAETNLKFKPMLDHLA